MTSGDIEIIKGDTSSILITFTDSAGAAINITGHTILFTVKKDLTDADEDAVIDKTITSHTTPTQGKTTLSLTAEQTNIEAGTYLFNFRRIDGSGNIASTSNGNFVVSQGVTKRAS